MAGDHALLLHGHQAHVGVEDGAGHHADAVVHQLAALGALQERARAAVLRAAPLGDSQPGEQIDAAGRRTGAAELINAAKRFGNADVQKAVQLSKLDSAGVLVPIQQSSEVIEFLRPGAALLKLGVRTQPVKGELHMGTQQTGTSVFKWVGAGETVPWSAPEYGKRVLTAHKGMVLTERS